MVEIHLPSSTAPTMDTSEPSLINDRSDKELPRAPVQVHEIEPASLHLSATEKDEPSRMEFRRESEEPTRTKSATDRVRFTPTSLKTLSPLPRRISALTENELPRSA